MPPTKTKLSSLFLIIFLCFANSQAVSQSEDWFEENLRKVDPLEDQWPSEKLHEQAKKQLKKLVNWGCHKDNFPSAIFSDNFHGSPIRASDFSDISQNKKIQILEGKKVEELELRGLTLWRKQQPWTDNAEKEFFKITSIELNEGKDFKTSVIAHIPYSEKEINFQINIEFDLTWSLPTSKELYPLLINFSLLSYQIVSAKKEFFKDVSYDIFKNVKRHKQELLNGVDKYINRHDRIIGNSLIGSNGIAIGDVNGDGRDDIYLAQQGGMPNKLFLHQDDGTVKDISNLSGTNFLDNTRGVLFCDFDNDNDQDLAITIGSSILIAYNNGSGIFNTHKALRMPNSADIYSLAAGDADNDGDLDIYACRYVLGGIMGGVPSPYHDANNGATNLFWRNEGDREWKECAAEVGLDDNNRKFSMAAAWYDFEQDGDLDLYVANDFGRNNLYVNDGNGHFKDYAPALKADDLGAGMGIDIQDYDCDGDNDLLITNMFSAAGSRVASQNKRFMHGKAKDVHGEYLRHARGNTLLQKTGNSFQDKTELTKMAVGGWGWGASFFDFDNDGYSDIYSPNGFITSADEKDL